MGRLQRAELMRVDLKVDTIDGSVSHEKVLEAYKEGRFKREGGGRNPVLKLLRQAGSLMAERLMWGLVHLLGLFAAMKRDGKSCPRWLCLNFL